MAEKYLRVTMPDGSKWDVPARFIAEHRARYYAEKDTGATSGLAFDNTVADEVLWVMRQPGGYEIEDWAANNMNWDDVINLATMVTSPSVNVDYQEGWVNGDKEVIER